MYRYYCIMRPPAPGAIPNGAQDVVSYDERRYVPEIDRMAWGYVQYCRELTMHEVADYELISDQREDE